MSSTEVTSVPVKKPRPAWVGVASAMVFPLFFVIMFSLCYVSAFHAPKPQDAPLYIVGPSAQTSAVVSGIDDSAKGAFDLKTTTSETVGKDAVTSRRAIGAIVVGGDIHAYVATGAGPITASTVEQIAVKLQAQEQQAADVQAPGAVKIGYTITNVAPLSSEDTVGTALFYFFIICTIAGYLTVTILDQVGAGIRKRWKYLTVFIAAILAPPITFGLSSIFVGNYGLDVGQVFALLGLGMFYSFTVGCVSLLASQIAGRAAIFLVLTLNIFLNFPSAGGAIPYTFLPAFWQGIHSFWFGAGSMEAFRDLVYFKGGAGLWTSFSHTAIWLLVTLAFSAVIGIRRSAPVAAAPIEPIAAGAAGAPSAVVQTVEPRAEHPRHAEGVPI